MHQKIAPDPFLILLSNPKQLLHARNSCKIRYLERGLSKDLKKLTLFFLSNPVPFNGQSYKKQKWCGTSDQSLFMLRNKFRKIPLFVIYLFVIYYLTKFDDVKQFLSYSRSPICKFLQVNLWHKLFNLHLSF